MSKTIETKKAVKFVTSFESIAILHKHCAALFQSMNKKFSSMLREGKILKIGSNKKVLVERENGDSDWITEANFIKEFLQDEVAPYEGLKVAKHTRTVYQGVLRKYYGKQQRDKPKMPTFCAFRTKNLVFSDAFLNFAKGNKDILEYKNITGEKSNFFSRCMVTADGRWFDNGGMPIEAPTKLEPEKVKSQEEIDEENRVKAERAKAKEAAILSKLK